MAKQKNVKVLPILPFGEGTLAYTSVGSIMYRKTIVVDGERKRLCVSADTVKQCLDKMRKKEREIADGAKVSCSEPLTQAVREWMELYKRTEVKPSSYDRLCITYNSQIKKMAIADNPWRNIATEDLQHAINALVQQGYSWSTIKKAYDMLNAFYTFQAQQGNLPRNPMDLCRMPARENILKPEKEIVYMTEPQIKVFCKEALSYAYGSNQLKYRYGPAFVFLIYTGLRVGELCALQWKDFDLERRIVFITKNLTEICNRDYGKKDNAKAPQYVIKISTTKTRATRIIPLNSSALKAYTLMRQATPFTNPDDYITATVLPLFSAAACRNIFSCARILSILILRSR